MKVYTGTGDGGRTSLFSGERLAKNDIRIEAYGTVDELNSMVGVISSSLSTGEPEIKIRAELERIQSELFSLGAWLATTPGSPLTKQLKPVESSWSKRLEQQMDVMQVEMDELRAFILPGGHPSAAWAQVARTVCRRTERIIVALGGDSENPEDYYEILVVYINRLSDYLFVLARYCNHITKTPETLWHG